MNKTILKLQVSRAIDKIGNIFYDYGNSAWLASMGAVGQQFLGWYQMADTLTSIIFNPISGALVDRFKRRHILLVTSLICALACLLAAFVADKQAMFYVLVGVNIVLAISGSFARLAKKSFIAEVVEKEEIIRYNSQTEAILQVISVASPIFSFLVLHYTNLRVTLFLDAFSFFISFVLIYAIKPEEIPYQMSHKSGMTIRVVLLDIVDGLRYIYQEKEVLFLLILAALVNFFMAGFVYLLPFADKLYGASGSYASLLTLGAVGSILAAVVSGKVKGSMNNLLLSLGLSGIGILLLGLSAIFPLPIWLSYSGNLWTEFFMTIFNIHYLSQIQIRVPNDMMGRVFSSVFTVAILFMPIGTALMSTLPNTIQISSFLIIGFSVVLLALIAYILSRKFFSE